MLMMRVALLSCAFYLGIALVAELAFYAVAHWVAGPLLGLKRPEWESDATTIGMHTANHLVFGLATAAGARAAARA